MVSLSPSSSPLYLQPRRWWKEATAYQIWPASFADSNTDGYGDIPGIISRLPYLESLGVDLIWLSPVYDSPQHDMGYDIRDYQKVWKPYGTMRDMERLIGEVKGRGMRLIMDLVVNHTSCEHRWFEESRKSRNNPYSDWYIWRDPRPRPDGGRKEPNNWKAAFGGSVWTWGEGRQQYYLHLALPEQPDLNWTNEEVRRAVYEEAVVFWLRKGVDGFRVDVVNFYCKDMDFPDAKETVPGEFLQPMEPQHVVNGPRMHGWLREERREVLDNYGEDVVMVGELPGTGPKEIMQYLDPKDRELDMIFDMDIFMAGNGWNTPPHEMKKTSLPEIKDCIVKTQSFIKDAKGWTTTFLESHDYVRSVSKFGPGEGPHHVAAARLLAMMIATLSGTLFLYQGQELGMSSLPKSWRREDFRDKSILRYLDEMDEQYPDDQEMKNEALAAAVRWSRDNARTPVQWSGTEPNAGFSDVEPWIRVNDNYKEFNAADQAKDPESILSFWKRMLELRKKYKDTVIYGGFELLDRENEKTMTFVKTSDSLAGEAEAKTKMLGCLNFSDDEQDVCLPDGTNADSLSLLLSSAGLSNDGSDKLDKLRPWEGRTFLL